MSTVPATDDLEAPLPLDPDGLSQRVVGAELLLLNLLPEKQNILYNAVLKNHRALNYCLYIGIIHKAIHFN